MIAQLMAQRMLSLDPDCDGAAAFRQALKLCSSRTATVPQLAGMQAALASSKHTPDIRDLCKQALAIRRATLVANQPRVSFSLEARGRLVGA